MPTIKDVARQASVSVATVSHVVNGTRFVSKELVKRVQLAMQELDYQPHRGARSLRTRRTNSIGLILSDITNPFFALVARGAEAAARERGYDIIISNTDEDIELERRSIDVLYERRVDGLLIAPTGGSDDRLRRVAERQMPLVFVDRKPAGVTADSVLSDNTGGALTAARYLLARGHRRIGLILGVEGTSTNDERRDGFLQAFAEAGLEPDTDLMVRGDFRIERGIRACDELLDASSPPTAIFSLNNLTAVGVLCALRERKLAYPGDVSVISFDSPWWMDHVLEPRLTYIRQEPYRIGREAMARLADVLELANGDGRGETGVLDLRIPTQLQEGGSVRNVGAERNGGRQGERR